MQIKQTEKLQKILANLGYGSRREIETFILEGRISIDGKRATIGDRLPVDFSEKIRLDGRLVAQKKQPKACRVLAYYKPEGELCTRNDPEGRATVFNRLPKIQDSRWIVIGRLDINTSGLLLFTNDGELANRLMHPRHQVVREYAVRIFGEVDDSKLRQLKNGIQLDDGLATFDSLKYSGGEGINQWYTVTLTEGRNREVRRMWEAVDVKVSRLIRTSYGAVTLQKGLPRGGWMELDLEKVNYLRELVELPRETQSILLKNRKQATRIRTGKIRRAIRKKAG